MDLLQNFVNIASITFFSCSSFFGNFSHAFFSTFSPAVFLGLAGLDDAFFGIPAIIAMFIQIQIYIVIVAK